MKWVFYIVVFVYMAYRAVYGAKSGTDVSIEKLNYGNDTFLRAGTRRSINCRAYSRNQRLEWVDPFNKVIKRVPTNRVLTQEHFVVNPYGGRAPALALVFGELLVKDTGVYQCRSGNAVQNLTLCVIKPSEFVDTPTEVSAALGRSITLTCQAKGDPEPNLFWSRNAELITEKNDSSKYKVNTKYNTQGYESLLTITSLEAEDSGVYNCNSQQKPPLDIDCGNSDALNITLQVIHAPIFVNSNDTKAVYGKTNDIVDLVCSASGFPAPTYRWFKAVDGETLAEFDTKQISYSEEDNQAVLSVSASATTFGQTYKCVATNSHGDAEKYFVLNKIQKPEKPSEVTFVYSTDSHIALNVSWSNEIDFPVEGFQIQYLKSKRKPKGFEWSKATEVYTEVDDEIYSEFSGLLVTIETLDEDTSYWLRLKARNNAGDSPWSEPVEAATDVKGEGEEAGEETSEESDEPAEAEEFSDATFYGIFFAGGIAVVVVACMFFMRLV